MTCKLTKIDVKKKRAARRTKVEKRNVIIYDYYRCVVPDDNWVCVSADAAGETKPRPIVAVHQRQFRYAKRHVESLGIGSNLQIGGDVCADVGRAGNYIDLAKWQRQHQYPFRQTYRLGRGAF